MREDDAATELSNSLSDCIDACGILCLRPSEARRDAVLDAVSWFVEAAPLVDHPSVRSPAGDEAIIRNGAAVAVRVKAEVLAWDGTTEPPPTLVNLAREFLVSIGWERVLDQNPDP